MTQCNKIYRHIPHPARQIYCSLKMGVLCVFVDILVKGQPCMLINFFIQDSTDTNEALGGMQALKYEDNSK